MNASVYSRHPTSRNGFTHGKSMKVKQKFHYAFCSLLLCVSLSSSVNLRQVCLFDYDLLNFLQVFLSFLKRKILKLNRFQKLKKLKKTYKKVMIDIS